MNFLRLVSSRTGNNLIRNIPKVSYSSQLGDLGSGAGKGGGGGGSIREAGGAFGRAEAAREEGYFHKQQQEQLKKLKEDLTDEISFHEEQIKRHQDAINRHKQRVSDIETKS
ncbi:hypothetical protein CBL_13620 [Carabus blaptoides fortunei]